VIVRAPTAELRENQTDCRGSCSGAVVCLRGGVVARRTAPLLP
jgi:hypothetical protein